ncbi:N-acetyl-D-glucosamine kinase [Pseudovibrio axinellae]|uniref:N-acetylglucosamine kinase n=1 Tax=Pseudovibrio axinellae TaxID=989403 RepID=A0A165T501_9HYPH|nr:ROK family protein [Pseudovibrio axinellae]KZL05438.1 N-acetyl-D-glucosamine kinase [Pseudovibrio axinellae]SEP99211.1 N-acetylglucosamine kinase [Pseudovibrio axinellae]
MVTAGGIDLGGTKIEATAFDEAWAVVESKRIATPKETYEGLVDALCEMIHWLEEVSGNKDLPIGVGIPGFYSKRTGKFLTANLPASGRTLHDDIISKLGRAVTFENDCNCFALSEAVLGAGRSYDTVFGLILGTGVGGGCCSNGHTVSGLNGAAGEYGHLGIPYAAMTKLGLEPLKCGCGRTGCFETYLAGPGISRLANHVTGKAVDAQTITKAAAAGDVPMQEVMRLWSQLAAELVAALQCSLDPDCIVLGGGLSKIPNIERTIAQALPGKLLNHTEPPMICVAQFGDSSGTRGAALAALQDCEHLGEGL